MEKKGKQVRDHMTNEEIASILDSKELSSEDKSALLASYWKEDDIPPQEVNKFSASEVGFEEKTRHTEESKTKNVIDHLRSDVTSEHNNECLSLDSSQQEKTTGALDPLTGKLHLKEKSSTIACNLVEKENTFPSKVDVGSSTSQRDNLEGEIQHTEDKTKGDRHNKLNDGTMKRIDESISPQLEAKEKVDLESKEKGKQAYHRTKEDIPPSEFDKSSTSSRIECEEKSPQMELKHESSSFRAQVTPMEGLLGSKEMKEDFLAVKSINGEAESNVDGKSKVERIHKEEAVCKYCHKYVFRENLSEEGENVLKAKCGCKVVLLIHEDCSSLSSDKKGDKCNGCDQEITYIGVSVSLETTPETSGQEVVQKPSSAPNRFWNCCLGT